MPTSSNAPTDRTVPGDGVGLHARDWGGDGTPVVLLHGLASNARIWDGVAQRLARARLAPPRFAVPLEDWLARAGRFAAGTGGGGWVRDYLRAGVDVDDHGVARARFRFDNHMQVVDALYDQRPSTLYPLVRCPVLLCPAAEDELAAAKQDAVARALRLLPDARAIWFEDTMHDIPLQRPAELADVLARFVKEAAS